MATLGQMVDTWPCTLGQVLVTRTAQALLPHLEQVVHPGADGRRALLRWQRPGAAILLPRHAAAGPRLLLGFQQVADAVDEVQQQLVRILYEQLGVRCCGCTAQPECPKQTADTRRWAVTV